MKRLVLLSKLVLLLLLALPGRAEKYWVFSIHELPNHYPLQEQKPIYCSSWLHACVFELSQDEKARLKDCGYEVQPVARISLSSSKPPEMNKLSFALEQIEADLFLHRGLTGKGVKIGIIDGGFLRADKDPSLKHFFEKELVKDYKDYITPDLAPYAGSGMLDDGHGTEVWQLIGGINPEREVRYGLASDAEYYLARTDHGGYEKRIEEYYLIEAMEWMVNQGVRIINISLGYSKGFTDRQENYQPKQMDGKTTAVARAVDYAVLQKGVLVVVAAGNEANDPWWRIVSSPGDAQYALTVGASKLDTWDKMNYSSVGPDFLSYVKPNISVYATAGTSYAAPVISGLAAAILQYDSSLSSMDVFHLLEQAGHFYPYPNNYLGYGVPTCSRLLKLLEDGEVGRPKEIRCSRNICKLGVEKGKGYVVVFHKRTNTVIKRSVYRPQRNKIKIKQEKEADQSSVVIGKEVFEIFWE